MLKRIASVFVLGVVATLSMAALDGRERARQSDDFVVHEWGTFTTVAGIDGRAMEWLPLGGPTDLPCFVRHFGTALTKLYPDAQAGAPLTYEGARSALWGKVRMETPVLYFYTLKDVTAQVDVSFPRGLITEFFPMASSGGAASVTARSLSNPGQTSFVGWRDVKIGPNVPAIFPNGGGQSHYYAARATDASPLQVGAEREKFLFYRGVANFDVPVQTKALNDGSVEIWNISMDGPLPTVILFENRNGRIGYRVTGPLTRNDTLAPPALDGSLPALRAELEAILVKGGLYPKEAAAMVETWRDSWFEEGTRVFYIVPGKTVDAILPLQVYPTPTNTTRVFVGRMDVITPETMRVVSAALASNDEMTLTRYNRFLSPIAERIIGGSTDETANNRIRAIAASMFDKYVKRVQVCE